MDFGEIFGYVEIAIWVCLGILAVFGAIKGFARGIGRQCVRSITVFASVLISYYITKLTYSMIAAWLSGESTENLLLMLEESGLELGDVGAIFLNMGTDSISSILAVPVALLILPIIFVIVFIVVSFLMLFLHAALAGIAGFSKRRNNIITRLLGFFVGAVQGALVTVICFVPVVGLLSSVSTAVETLQTNEPDSAITENATALYETNFKEAAEGSAVKLFGKLGANLLYKNLSTVSINGEIHDTSSELPAQVLMIYGSTKDIGGIHWDSLTEEDKAALNLFISTIDNSDYVKVIIASFLDAAATATQEDSLNLFSSEGLTKDFIDATFSIFVGIDEDSLVPTLEVIRDVYFILSDEQVFATLSGDDTSAISDIFTKKDENGETLISKVTRKLNSNPRTTVLVSALTKISMNVMADSFGGAITEETYDNVKTGINDVLSIKKEDFEEPEEYVGAISESLNNTFKDNGVELEPEIVDEMAQYVADNFSEVEELSDAEINDIILSYYDAYINAGGKLPGQSGGESGGDGTGEEGENGGTLPSLPDGFDPSLLPDGFDPSLFPGLNP